MAQSSRESLEGSLALSSAMALDSTRAFRTDRNATRLASAPECGWDVGMVGPEELAGGLGGFGLDNVDVVAAGVKPVERKSLGVLVGEEVAMGQLGRQGGIVFRWR